MECLHPKEVRNRNLPSQKIPKILHRDCLEDFRLGLPWGTKALQNKINWSTQHGLSSFLPTLSSSDWNWDKESIACTGACQVHPMQIMTKKLAIYLVPLIQGLKAVIFMHGDVATSADEFQLLRQTAEISWNVDMEAHEIMNLIWSHISFIIRSNQVFKYIHTSRSLAEVEDSICSSTCHKIHKQVPWISINFIKFRGHRRHLEKPALVAFSCSLKRSNAMSSLCTSSGCLVDKGIRICRLKRADWCSFYWVCCRCWCVCFDDDDDDDDDDD